jgi:trimethylamine---corrinoid protein Co-methyltransferase
MKKIQASVEVLSQSEIEMIHKGSLDILENIGIKVPNDECLTICERLGAKVDRDSEVVRIPASLMEEIITIMRKARLYEQSENKVERLYGYISTQTTIVDYKTKTRRAGTLDDVKKGIVLVDQLDNFKENNIIVIPSEYPKQMMDVVAFQMVYSYSKKLGKSWILLPESAKYIVQMANFMGKWVNYSPETISPLQFRKESLEIALVFAKEAKYMYMGPMVMSGATGPVTLAGTVTLQNAEALASIFVIYALNNQFSFYNTATHSMDLRTMICSFGSPNQALLGMCIAQLGRFYGLKAVSNAGLTDALMPDFQGGFEKASSTIFSCLAGAAGIGCQGIVGADQGISLEQLALDNEWLDAYNYILKGIEVTTETIALDLIKNVGIGGNFLCEEHTVKYMRDNYWQSKIFNRESWDSFYSKNTPDLLDRVHDYVQSVIEDKPIEPVIEGSKLEELDYIVKCAQAELVK